MQDSQQVVITAGLNVGDRVVTDGIDRLTEGMQVEVVTPQAASVAAKASQPTRAQGKS
ncbi:Multidrug resistance protein MdtA precursor [compost metagenome]